jgi:PD-(D/E)XK nuclease superfamily
VEEGPPSAAAQRGSRLHLNAEEYIKGDCVPLCKEMLPLGPELERMKQNGWLSEEVWLCDRDWLPVVREEDAWCKAIVDLHKIDELLLEIVDLKSGKRYPEHEDQLRVYALMGLKRFPGVQRVDVSAWYVDEGGRFGNQMSYMPQMFDHYVAEWNALAEAMFADEEFIPTPSKNACRWCPFKASKGGTCQEGDMF